MTRYAEGTQVDETKSRAEIEKTLRRYGATEFMYATKDGKAMIAFKARGRFIRFLLPLPGEFDDEFKYTPARRFLRTDKERLAAWEQACRQRWRALALLIKAQLEAVETGIVSFEDVFLAMTVLPTGQTMNEWAAPQIAEAYSSGCMPRSLMPGMGDR